jgi:glucose-6-phosphate isomerase
MEYNLSKLAPDIRYLNEIRNVLYDKNLAKSSDDFELYYMYRGLEEKNGLRYDITVIPAKMLGQEFAKTKGHEHIGLYQEIYVVLEGKAIYLMQKRKDTNEIEDVYAVRAEKGDTVIIPSSYGHVTINPSETEELRMANWISKDCKSDYSLFEKFCGACYYYTKDSSAGSEPGGWLKNENYKKVPALRFEEPLKEVPKNLEFLKQG